MSIKEATKQLVPRKWKERKSVMLKSPNTCGPAVIVSEDVSYAFPFGVAYLAGYLTQHGQEVQVLFRPRKPRDLADFAQRLIDLRPLVVGFSGLYPELYPVRETIKILDGAGRSFPIVVGGQMVSPTPEFAVGITGADYGAIGEGEIIFHELVTSLREGKDASDVKGLVIRRDRQTIENTGPGEYIRDMSRLPPIPYDLFPSEKWLHVGRHYVSMAQPHWHFNDRVISIHGGRGCPFNCNFCYHHSHARYRKVPEMIAEADDLLERYDANMLYFGDDLVLSSPKRARQLTEAIGSLKRPVEYSVSNRFDILSRMDDDLLRDMKRTGCRIMGLGIESGSQRILDAMNKRIMVDQILTGLSRLKDAGILPTVSIMVGQVSETIEDAEKSLALMIETVRNDQNVQYAFPITTPFPGSELYNCALEKGLLKDHRDFFEQYDPDRGMSKVIANQSNMTDEEIYAMQRKMIILFGREKWNITGRKVFLVERTRGFLARVDRGLGRFVFRRLPQYSAITVWLRLYRWLYENGQIFLDRLRLRLLGVEPVKGR